MPRVIFLTFIYLFIFRERGREGEREGEIHPLVASHTHPQQGTWAANQAFALTGNQPLTFSFAGWCSIHWAIPPRAKGGFLQKGGWDILLF